MKKLLATLAVTPLAISACGSKHTPVVNTVTHYTLGHGKRIDANNGTLGTQNDHYDVIESKVTKTDGKLTYVLNESTNYLNIKNTDTQVTLPGDALAAAEWEQVTPNHYVPTISDMEVYFSGLTYPYTLNVPGSDGTAAITMINEADYKAKANAYRAEFVKLSDAERAALVNNTGTVGLAPNANEALRWHFVDIDMLTKNGDDFQAARATWLNSFPKKDLHNNGSPVPANNIGESLRYVYDVVKVDANYINKLTDGTNTNLPFVAKNDTNYGHESFNFTENAEALVAYANKTYDTCAKVKIVADSTISDWASNKNSIKDTVAGATFIEGGLYLASLITAAKANC